MESRNSIQLNVEPETVILSNQQPPELVRSHVMGIGQLSVLMVQKLGLKIYYPGFPLEKAI